MRNRDKKDRKKFKDTKVGGLISKVAPGILETVGNFLPDMGILGVVGKMIKGDKNIAAIDKDEIMKLLIEEENNYLKDRQDARDLQKVALQQDDLFSKRFVYVFAFVIFGSSMAMIFLLFFVEIPEGNKTLIDMAVGAIIGSGLSGIISYFYGSSKGSKDKTSLLNQLNQGNRQ